MLFLAPESPSAVMHLSSVLLQLWRCLVTHSHVLRCCADCMFNCFVFCFCFFSGTCNSCRQPQVYLFLVNIEGVIGPRFQIRQCAIYRWRPFQHPSPASLAEFAGARQVPINCFCLPANRNNLTPSTVHLRQIYLSVLIE